jgi:hypothetical protein
MKPFVSVIYSYSCYQKMLGTIMSYLTCLINLIIFIPFIGFLGTFLL